MLANAPLIHDDNRGGLPGWAEWFKAAGVDGVDLSRGLRFNSADHALDAVIEGAGVFLSHDVLAHDDLRTGRLVAPCKVILDSGYAYHVVCQKSRLKQPNVQAFHSWIRAEVASTDWSRPIDEPRVPGSAAGAKRRRSPRK
jgi:LysR family glycine cleavage system transcriptional activator